MLIGLMGNPCLEMSSLKGRNMHKKDEDDGTDTAPIPKSNWTYGLAGEELDTVDGPEETDPSFRIDPDLLEEDHLDRPNPDDDPVADDETDEECTNDNLVVDVDKVPRPNIDMSLPPPPPEQPPALPTATTAVPGKKESSMSSISPTPTSPTNAEMERADSWIGWLIGGLLLAAAIIAALSLIKNPYPWNEFFGGRPADAIADNVQAPAPDTASAKDAAPVPDEVATPVEIPAPPVATVEAPAPPVVVAEIKVTPPAEHAPPLAQVEVALAQAVATKEEIKVTPPTAAKTAAASKATAKAAETEAFVITGMGKKPVCKPEKAQCTWGDLTVDDFPKTTDGKMTVICGSVTYHVAKIVKITSGDQKECFRGTGITP
jgi:hypothetical protein